MNKKYYVVKIGRITGGFKSWSKAQSSTKGYSGAVCKSFNLALEAPAFANSSSGYTFPHTDIVYTDGSSKSNGKSIATAGYGVYYGEGDKRNYSGKLEGPIQTNQRAELKAVDYALATAQKGSKNITIYTDSAYSKHAITEWGNRWDQNGYKTARGKAVVNSDLIQSARSRIADLKARNIDVKIEHVRGHSGNPGNNAADRLAKHGAML